MRISRSCLAALMILFMSQYAVGAQAAGAPPQQNQSFPKQDTSGKGAVLCGLYLYVEAPAAAHLCGLSNSAADAAFDEAISRIDKFVIENAEQPVTQSQMDDFRKLHSAQLTASLPRGYGSVQKYCQSRDFEFVRHMYEATPADIKTSIDNLLSVPREPLMNPCL
jgi:hypothetical protein